MHASEGFMIYDKSMTFTVKVVVDLPKKNRIKEPEELQTQITRKNFSLPFSRERQGESQMTRITQTSRTMFKANNQAFRHSWATDMTRKSLPSTSLSSFHEEVIQVIIPGDRYHSHKYRSMHKHFCMSMQNNTNTSSTLQKATQTDYPNLAHSLTQQWMFVFLTPAF